MTKEQAKAICAIKQIMRRRHPNWTEKQIKIGAWYAYRSTRRKRYDFRWKEIGG